MKRVFKGRKRTMVLLVSVGILVTSIGISRATFADPGSQDDPLVTLSFIEKRFEQFKYYIDQKVEELLQSQQQLSDKVDHLPQGGQATSTLEVVELRNGQRLIGKAGTEIILRGGKAKAIGSDLGGLSDLTGADDIQTNGSIPANHLLLIPRNDGRGVYVDNYAIFIIRGDYTIK